MLLKSFHETRKKSSYTVTDAWSKQQKQNRIIVIKIVPHHGELVNVSKNEAIEASGISMAPVILFVCLVK